MNKIHVLLHSAGLGCLAGAAGLQMIVFWTIWDKGKFVGSERILAILAFEVCIAIFAILYLGYLFVFRFKAEVFDEGY